MNTHERWDPDAYDKEVLASRRRARKQAVHDKNPTTSIKRDTATDAELDRRKKADKAIRKMMRKGN